MLCGEVRRKPAGGVFIGLAKRFEHERAKKRVLIAKAPVDRTGGQSRPGSDGWDGGAFQTFFFQNFGCGLEQAAQGFAAASLLRSEPVGCHQNQNIVDFRQMQM